jgi:hypothetical protein
VNVYKKIIIFRPTSTINRVSAEWKIKLKPNVGFVKLGNEMISLSNMKEYYDREKEVFYPSIEVYPPTEVYPSIVVYPQKFPYVCK